jgi:hypothetical protein
VANRERQYLLLADEDLISLAGNGDAGAFAGLYDRHSRASYSLAYRMMETVRRRRTSCRRVYQRVAGGREL